MNAIAVFKEKLSGFVKFEQKQKYVRVIGYIEGLKKNNIHAIHVHEYGDLSDGCDSACSHFNPFNKKHGGRNDKERHVGDLGNIYTNSSFCILVPPLLPKNDVFLFLLMYVYVYRL